MTYFSVKRIYKFIQSAVYDCMRKQFVYKVAQHFFAELRPPFFKGMKDDLGSQTLVRRIGIFLGLWIQILH